MNGTPPTLEPFETRLLQELRAHVTTREPEATPIRPTDRRRRWAAGLAVAAVAATAYVVVSPGGPAVSPAYAVTQQADGDVVVTIHRLEDAAGLEAALAEHGIEADVSFEPDQFEVAEVPNGELDEYEMELPNDPGLGLPPAGDCGDPNSGFDFNLAGSDYVLTIPADSVLLDQSVLRLTTASEVDGEGYGLTATYTVGGTECGFATYAVEAD